MSSVLTAAGSYRAHSIHIPAGVAARRRLPQGGLNPQGREIRADSCSLTLDGQPWLPVMGEFHFSRCPGEYWEEELYKMKAGGVTVAAAYLFWIHIEEVEGQFNWAGNNDLRRFIQLCQQVGLYAYPRIGPWAHGECRNGGFPDWLLEKCGSEVRAAVEPYLTYVRRYYQEVYRQVEGLFWKDGGPIIGIQIENEMLNNPGYLHTLLGMARETGFDTPLYTMTGWGPAETPPGGELIPVFGGYPDAFWDRQVNEWSRSSRKHYFFSHLRDDNTVGADLNKRADVFDLTYLEDYPFGTCELGGGMQIAYHRRPFICTDDIAALAQAKIGSGSNLQGYYMYHGGANPLGQLSTLQESQDTGYWNDLPVINYDFQAPIGQYGQTREVFHALRVQHLFLHDFGSSLAPLPMHLPDQVPTGLDDVTTLRWAARSDGQRGFVFINNYQRIEPLPDHPGVQFELRLPGETLRFPIQPVTIPGGAYAIWPFNLTMEGVLLKYATVQPVCRLVVETRPTYVFFAQDGMDAELAFEAASIAALQGPGQQFTAQGQLVLRGFQPGTDCWMDLTSANGQPLRLLVLTQHHARQVWKASLWGQERLVLCADSLHFKNGQIEARLDRPDPLELFLYPGVDRLTTAAGQPLERQEGERFIRFVLKPPVVGLLNAQPVCLAQPAGPAREVPLGPLGVAQAPTEHDFEQAAVWQIELPESLWSRLDDPDISDIFLRIHYAGDAARLYAGERLLDDQFYYGAPWEIGLRRFRSAAEGQALTLRILPLRRDAPIYLPPERWPDFGGSPAIARLGPIELFACYRVLLTLA